MLHTTLVLLTYSWLNILQNKRNILHNTVLCKSNANDNRGISWYMSVYRRYLTRIYLKWYIEQYIVRAVVFFLGEISPPVSIILFPLCDISFLLHNISFLLCDISFLLSKISFQVIVLALWNTHTLLQKSFMIMTNPLRFKVSFLRWRVAS